MTDEEAARQSRAKELEQQIEELSSGQTIDEAPDAAPQDENARDFIHRRMSELDKEKGTSKE